MNKTIQTVIFGKDPEVSTSRDGKSIVKFSAAVKRRFHKEGDTDTDWFNYVAFGATADFIAKYFHKGSKALITGTFQNNNYTKEDGTKVFGFQMLVENIEFFGSKSDNEVTTNTENSATDQAATDADSAPATEAYSEYDDF